MLDLAWKMIRAHRGGLVGTFVALLGASALITACGIILQSGLSPGVAPQRYAGAAVVVGGPANVAVTRNGKTKHKPLTERATLPVVLVDRVAQVRGVRTAIGDVSFPAEVIDRHGEPVTAGDGSLGHGWASAALTPVTLASGHPPTTVGEVVLDAVLARRARVTSGDRIQVMAGSAPATYQVSGVARSRGADRRPALFFADPEAERIAGRPEPSTPSACWPRRTPTPAPSRNASARPCAAPVSRSPPARPAAASSSTTYGRPAATFRRWPEHSPA
ncbi:hypothetical protein GCM10029978_000910 [Actinoallomurus acanthiterrae]